MKVLKTLILASIITTFGCSKNENKPIEVVQGPLSYEAVPIRLQPDSNFIEIKGLGIAKDIFEKASIGESTVNLDDQGRLVIINSSLSHPIENLHIQLKNGEVDIPLFKSEKIKYTFHYSGSNTAKEVFLAGSVNGWNNKGNSLVRTDSSWHATFDLVPGRYPYRLWIDGAETLDATNEKTMDNGLGGLNSYFDVGDINAKSPFIITQKVDSGKVYFISEEKINHALVYANNTLIAEINEENTSFSFQLPKTELDRMNIRVYSDNGTLKSNDLLIPTSKGQVIQNTKELSRKDWQHSVMYFMMVDRFVDGDSANNRPTLSDEIMPQANNLGGDLQGIIQKINDGYFEKLGVNTLWISPISKNAEGAWGLWDKGVHSRFSAYHGYWPTALTAVDDRFGSMEAFNQLVNVAHEHNMNVILDYVAHHVHENHPLYQEHPDWSTNLHLPDGRLNTELWDEQRLTTWFDVFLPTWDFSKPEVVDALTDTALYWMNNTELDGFRHDATKHIPVEFWKALTFKMRNVSGKNLFQIGETYGSPELISSYISNDQLNAQFDFNLYDAMVDAFAKSGTGFENLARVMTESLNTYGYHNTMGNITGNQDRARFVSYADGSIDFSEDAKLAGWTRDIENKGEVGYQRMAMLQAFLMTSPGIPCIYYGDEIAMPGGNDPDNRRMMQFDGLSKSQSDLRDIASRLIQLRQNSMALTYGDIKILAATNNYIVFSRTYFNDEAIVVLHKNANSKIAIDLPVGRITQDWKVSGKAIK
ncbi:MAG: alpha-amylase family glycosyl hydrolase [Flavobacteriales bacterium]